MDPDGHGPGIITERDVLISVGAGQDPDAETVADHLTRDVVFAAPDWSLEEAAAAMVRGGFRHLIVLDAMERRSASSRSATSCAAGPRTERSVRCPPGRPWGETGGAPARGSRRARSPTAAGRGEGPRPPRMICGAAAPSGPALSGGPMRRAAAQARAARAAPSAVPSTAASSCPSSIAPVLAPKGPLASAARRRPREPQRRARTGPARRSPGTSRTTSADPGEARPSQRRGATARRGA